MLGLRYIHKEKHIVHRDLTPNNIMLGENDKVTISEIFTLQFVVVVVVVVVVVAVVVCTKQRMNVTDFVVCLVRS